MLATLCALGIVWLTWSYMTEGQQSIIRCPSKLIYHAPCPTCGTTRACLLLLHGHPWQAFVKNPNVVPAVAFLLGFPILGLYDGLTGRRLVRRIFEWLGDMFDRRCFLVSVLVAEAAIWAHNIYIGN